MDRVTFGSTSGDLAVPAGDGKHGALVVIHEWWGLNDDTRRLAARFADEGFLALAVDIYHGPVTSEPSEAMRLSSEMKTENALEDIRAAVAFLAAHPRSNGRAAVTGFCLGGAVALAAAFQVDGLSAAIPFYGIPRADFVDFAKKTPPIQGHYASKDTFVDAERTRAIAEGVRAAGGSFELFVYEANHAFMRAGDPAAYDEASAKLAWSRAVPFLRSHIGAP
ncbi:MAG: dienelactone hydrolase family protein [Polyangiaceae bacterium]